MAQLKIGDKAPDFVLPGDGGTDVKLSAFKGRKVIVYFYPKDDTSGCTKEACGFRDQYAAIQKAGAVVLGVSADTLKSHVKFTDKHQLPFPLISDPEAVVANAFGAWGEKVYMGRKYQGMHRVTFLIGRDGRIARIWDSVKPEIHAAEVLEALKAL